MKAIVYVSSEGHLAKAALETVSYASKIASEVTVITTGSASSEILSTLGSYGASAVWVDRNVTENDAQQLTKVVAKAVETSGSDLIIFSHDLIGKSVAPRLSVKLQAGLVSGAIALPDTNNGFSCKVNVFSGKAFGNVTVSSAKKIISLLPNSIQPEHKGGSATVTEFDGGAGTSAITVISTKKPEGEIPLPEAELVVSAGRGLKGPENWGIVEDLAKALGAATACSRPVADIGWRPHHEHVGQTGVAIRPNLYIAAGISGAIQHLAGVNGSKVIVVINSDAEAPFFGAADYGIVGDAFQVLPRLTEAVKKFKAAQ
jgi:electron transfer flavoprotein alpha subunit